MCKSWHTAGDYSYLQDNCIKANLWLDCYVLMMHGRVWVKMAHLLILHHLPMRGRRKRIWY